MFFCMAPLLSHIKQWFRFQTWNINHRKDKNTQVSSIDEPIELEKWTHSFSNPNRTLYRPQEYEMLSAISFILKHFDTKQISRSTLIVQFYSLRTTDLRILTEDKTICTFNVYNMYI